MHNVARILAPPAILAHREAEWSRVSSRLSPSRLSRSAVITEARVTRIEIAKVERVESPSAGAQNVRTPPYERMSGKFYGELDPADPKNALITDIQLAPRNARGKVEYVGTFSLMKPVDCRRRAAC